MLVSTSRGPARGAFIFGSLVWLPVGLAVIAVLRSTGLPVEPQTWLTLVMIAPCGLPLALPCRRLLRGGYPGPAWIAFAVLAPATIAASLFAGLFGALAIAGYAAVISLPVWITARLLVQRRPFRRRLIDIL